MTHLELLLELVGIYEAYATDTQNVATMLQRTIDALPELPREWNCPAEYAEHFYKLKSSVGDIQAVLPLLTAYAKRLILSAPNHTEFDIQLLYGLKLHAIAGLCSCWLPAAATKPMLPSLLEDLKLL